MRRDVRDRNDKVQPFPLDQILHEPIEGLGRSGRRRIGDMAVAVPGRRRQTDWPLRSDQHRDAAAAQRTGNRERWALVAVGDEGRDMALAIHDILGCDRRAASARSLVTRTITSIAPMPATSSNRSPTEACRPGTND